MTSDKSKHTSIKKILKDVSIEGAYENETDRKYKRLVARTILRLPEKVRNKVINDVDFFISTKPLFGFANSRKIPLINRKSGSMNMVANLIFINFHDMIEAKRTEDEMMQIIAHEIAHIELRHPFGRSYNCEKLAEVQTRLWGFRPKRSFIQSIRIFFRAFFKLPTFF